MDSGTGQLVLGVVLDTDGARASCRLRRSQLTSARKLAEDEHPAAVSVGGVVKITVGERLLFGMINELATDRTDPDAVIAGVDYMGEGPSGPDGNAVSFRRGLSLYPQPGDEVRFATEADFVRIFAPPDLPYIEVGTVYPTVDVRAPVLFDALMGRHFAIVGSSGAGKSTTVALLLDRIIASAPHGHIVILDPHGEYAHAFGDKAKVWDVDNLQLPFWAMNFEEHCEAFISARDEDRTVDANILAKCLLKARTRNIHFGAGSITADSPVPYQLADLLGALDDEAGRLEKLADSSRYTQLRLTIEQFFHDRRFSFVFNADYYESSLETFLAGLLRIPAQGRPISIVDLAGVPTEIINVVVASLTRLLLDHAIWSHREQRSPVLLVCEEAHRYLPRVRSAATRSVERQLERVAREGRKYGVCLGMVSQRPSELSETALSQCGTIISMRLNNLNDQAQLRASLPEGARGYVEIISTLKNQECVICGDGVPVPMRVLIDTLPADRRPASDDPVFSTSWNDDTDGTPMLAATVSRWRKEG